MSSFNDNLTSDDISPSSSSNNLESQMKNVPFEDQLLYKTWLLMAAQQHSPGIFSEKFHKTSFYYENLTENDERLIKVRILGRLTWPDDLELDLQQEISNSIYNG